MRLILAALLSPLCGQGLPQNHSLVEANRTMKLTLLGGSSSAIRKPFAFFSAQTKDMAFYNPSQGYTGSEWGAMYLDQLVPLDTTHLVWEFAMN